MAQVQRELVQGLDGKIADALATRMMMAQAGRPAGSAGPVSVAAGAAMTCRDAGATYVRGNGASGSGGAPRPLSAGRRGRSSAEPAAPKSARADPAARAGARRK